MEEKTTAIKREILTKIVEGYGTKGKKIIVKRVKDAGVYKSYQSDEEVWDLVKKFAEHHKIYICEDPEKKEEKEPEAEPEIIKIYHEKPENEDEAFLKELEKEHALLSKKLLALNKIIAIYKKEK